MSERERPPSSGRRDELAAGDHAVEEDAINRAGLGSPPANIDRSHRPDLFDIGATKPPLPDLLDADRGSAGGLGEGLGGSRGGFSSIPVGGAGVGPEDGAAIGAVPGTAVEPNISLGGGTDTGVDNRSGYDVATDAEEDERAIGFTGSTDPQDVEDESASVAQSDLGGVALGDARGPGAGLGASGQR
jgi:hypothetical protein